MGWTDAFRYFKAVKEPAPVSNSRPFKAVIGSLVTLPDAIFMRANMMGSLMREPKDMQPVITAISRLKLPFNGKVYRYYFEKGDNEGNESFLQCTADDQGEVIEVAYCQRLMRFYPETEEDIDAFTGEKGFGLGEKTYTVFNEQLLDAGFTEDQLKDISPEGKIDFTRDIGEGDFYSPITGVEIRSDSKDNAQGLEQKIWFMPYVRKLQESDSSEWLYISTEAIESKNGSREKGFHVDLMVTLLIEPSRLLVQ